MKKFKKIKLTLLVAFMASQFVVPFYKKNVFATNSFKQNVVDEDSEIEVPVLRHVDGRKATDVVLQHQLIKEKEKSLIESAKQSEPELYNVLNEDKTVPKTYFVLGVGLYEKKSDDFSVKSVKYQDVLDLFRGREDLNLSVRVVSTEGKVLARGKKKKSVLSDIEVLTFVIPADLVPNGKNTCKLEFYEGDVLIGTVENFGTVMEACRFGPKEVREAYASGKMSAEKVLNNPYSFKQNVVDEDSEIEVPVLRHVDGHKATDVVLQHQLIKEKEKSLIESAKQSEPELYDVLNEDKTVPKTYFVLGVGLKESDDSSIKYQDVLDLFRGRENSNLSVRVVSTEGKVLARGKKKKSVLLDSEDLTFVIPADLVPNGKNTCKLEFYEGDVLIGTVENFGTVMEACRFGPKEVREAYASGKMSAEKVLNNPYRKK